MIKFIRLYWVFIKQYFKKLMEYRFDFLTGAMSFLIVQITTLIFMTIIFGKIPAMAGYTFYQVLFIYGFSLFPKGLDHLFADLFWELCYFRISKGEFDRYMTRPINPLIQIIIECFQIDAFGELIVGVAIVCYAAVKIGLIINALNVILFILVIPFGALIYTSFKIMITAIAIVKKRSGAILKVVYSMNEFSQYPVTIYNKIIQNIISYIIPFAFAAYYPASYFLTGKNPLFNIGGVVLISAVFLTLSLLIWNKALTKYESAGS